MTQSVQLYLRTFAQFGAKMATLGLKKVRKSKVFKSGLSLTSWRSEVRVLYRPPALRASLGRLWKSQIKTLVQFLRSQ